MSYYKCKCGHEFSEFATGYTGVEKDGARETEGVCPECGGSDVDEGHKCRCCGRWFDSTHSTIFCDSCRKCIATIQIAEMYGNSFRKDGYNPLMVYLAEREYGKERLNEMLCNLVREDVRMHKQFGLTGADAYIDDFLSDDYANFDNWFVEGI